MNYSLKGMRFFIFILLFLELLNADSGGSQVQDDPVEAPAVSTAPIFDGIGDDACWVESAWQSIDQVWMPYGVTISADDYTGRYKVAWSPEENRLYFLVEVTDDVFIDGYRYSQNSQTADVYNFDIVEVFIDEDKSGGLHVFDGTGSTGQQWGTNAENAFAYHIYADFPADGNSTSTFRVNDQDGTGWPAITKNYAAHFPQFALRRNGQQAVWEFALIVYDDTYEDELAETAWLQLTAGKEIGISLAYCENDAPDGLRDNFFGSVHVEHADSNNHWINADDFGTVKLIAPAEAIKVVKTTQETFSFQVFPNPAKDFFRIALDENLTGRFEIRLFNLLGREIYHNTGMKINYQPATVFTTRDLGIGMYFIEIKSNNQRSIRKVLITK